jgi:EAL domain-containing protein (putative c-di-GMP-specific phosphodiesterase class I)
LLRLANEEGGEPFTPNTFLNAAERFALIQTIDLWVIRKAIGLIAAQASTGRKVKLSVNLSACSVADPKLAALIEAALAETIIDPTCLVFELAETAAIANIEMAKTFAWRLRSHGCQFALDNFGAGFGSFYYLKNLPFDYIKIDGVFIRGIAETPMDQLVVQAMVAIAKGMGKKTIAEFVSDEGATSVLRKIGVDYAQGYHVGRPQPVAEVLAAARDREA